MESCLELSDDQSLESPVRCEEKSSPSLGLAQLAGSAAVAARGVARGSTLADRSEG